MALVADGREIVWIVRGVPIDPTDGLEREVWLATKHVVPPATLTDGEHEFQSWLQFGSGGATNISFGDVLDSLFGTGDFVVTVRFRTTNTQNAILMGKGISTFISGPASDVGWAFGLRNNAGTPELRGVVSDGTNRVETGFTLADYDDGEWHTASFEVVRAGSILLELDGVFAGASNISTVTDSLSNDENLLFGESSTGAASFTDGDAERAFIHTPTTVPQDELDLLLHSPFLVEVVPDVSSITVHGGWQFNRGFGGPFSSEPGHAVQDVSGADNHGVIAAGDIPWGPTNFPPVTIRGALQDPFSLQQSVLSGNRISPRTSAAFGDITVFNKDGELDDVIGFSWLDRRVEVYRGLDGDALTSYELIAIARAGELENAERDEFVVPTRPIDAELFTAFLHRKLVSTAEVPVVGNWTGEPDLYVPGFEPTVLFDGIDDWIDFGDNLDRGSVSSFVWGVAFRTTAALHVAGLYGKKTGLGTVGVGYQLGLGPGGAIRLDLGDGDENQNITHTPTGGYNSGERISVAGEVNRSTNIASLHVRIGEGAWSQVGTVDISTLGDLDNTQSLAAAATNSGSSNFFDGEIERVVAQGGLNLANVQDFLDERFPEDFDTSIFGGAAHAVPIDENVGNTVGDLGAGGFDGTILNGPTWTLETVYSVGDFVTPTSPAGQLAFEATTGGVSGTTEPTWPTTVGETVNDGSVVWTARAIPWVGLRNGTRELDGRPIPIQMGVTPHVELVLIDPIKLIYQVKDDPSVPTNFATAVVSDLRESGSPINEDTTTTGSIWFHPPAVGEWRQQYVFSSLNPEVGSTNPGHFVRLANQPTGVITASVTNDDVGATGFADTAAIVQEVLTRSGVNFDFDGKTELRNAAGYNAGFYTDERMTIAEALDLALEGTGFSWGVDPRNPFNQFEDYLRPRVFFIDDVSGETPDATYILAADDAVSDITFDGLRRVQLAPVFKEVTAQYERFVGFQPFGTLLESVPASVRRRLSQEWREVTIDESTIVAGPKGNPSRFRADETLTFRMLVNRVFGQPGVRPFAFQEALRRFNLHSLRRLEIWTAQIALGQFERRLGDVVFLKDATATPRFELGGSGRAFIVVGTSDSSEADGTLLTLFGGWPVP